MANNEPVEELVVANVNDGLVEDVQLAGLGKKEGRVTLHVHKRVTQHRGKSFFEHRNLPDRIQKNFCNFSPVKRDLEKHMQRFVNIKRDNLALTTKHNT